MAATGSGDEELTRRERREQYERVISIVDANSGGKQRPMAALSTVRTIAGYVDIKPKHVKKRLEAAVANGDLVIVEGRVALADEETVRAAIRREGERDHPRQDRLAKLNQALHGGGR